MTADTEEESKENRSIKQKIKELIIDAHTAGNFQIFNQSIELLRKSTGCAGDYEIFIDIADDLVERNIIGIDEVKKILENSPLDRWL